jgi:hypothetical protein
MQNKDRNSRGDAPSGRPDELPYRVELWRDGGTEGLERVLARALSVQVARAIFKAATDEHPHRRITLRRGSRIVADSMPQASVRRPT